MMKRGFLRSLSNNFSSRMGVEGSQGKKWGNRVAYDGDNLSILDLKVNKNYGAASGFCCCAI
jgi:hypothetical protein